MEEILISKESTEQRLDKFLMRYLNNAPKGFIYKMLRKKNITLNGKRGNGSEILQENDIIKLFLSAETIEKFKSRPNYKKGEIDIIYEDNEKALLNKPANLLTQPDTKNGDSLISRFVEYFGQSDFTPVCINRLDRNTSGLVLVAKTLHSAQKLSKMMREGQISKFYTAIVEGEIKEKLLLEGFHEKVYQGKFSIKSDGQGAQVFTEITPIKHKNNQTLLRIKLITGKTHQIRAHLASINYPIVGDIKYGNGKKNQRQLLHCTEIIIADQSFKAPPPSDMAFPANMTIKNPR